MSWSQQLKTLKTKKEGGNTATLISAKIYKIKQKKIDFFLAVYNYQQFFTQQKKVN